MKLTEHFDLEEAVASQQAIRHGIDNFPTPTILQNVRQAARGMEVVRKLLGNKTIIVSSWYRNPQVNRLVGGSPTSSHQSGWAIDFICPKFGSPYHVAKHLENKLKYDQLIHEFGRWVHISFDPMMRQQELSIFSGTGYIPGIIPGVH